MPSAVATPDSQLPSFPNPATFSILPEIYLLISRLKVLEPELQAGTATFLQPKTPGGTTASTLDLKELSSAAIPIKQKIQKARTVVGSLPDMDNGIAEQECRIRMMGVRIEALKGRLRELGSLAGQKDGMVAFEESGKEEDILMQESTGE